MVFGCILTEPFGCIPGTVRGFGVPKLPKHSALGSAGPEKRRAAQRKAVPLQTVSALFWIQAEAPCRHQIFVRTHILPFIGNLVFFGLTNWIKEGVTYSTKSLTPLTSSLQTLGRTENQLVCCAAPVARVLLQNLAGSVSGLRIAIRQPHVETPGTGSSQIPRGFAPQLHLT